jgi:hypoxanthine phosphoribosyltransferase
VSDLVRALERPDVEVDFLVAALYGDGTDAAGDVRLLYEAEAAVEGRHVLLVEDIVDSGKTLARIGDALARQSPRSLEVCALLHKRLTRRLKYEPRWVGFEAPSDWLVGYGLDHGDRYRHLPYIASIRGEENS